MATHDLLRRRFAATALSGTSNYQRRSTKRGRDFRYPESGAPDEAHRRGMPARGSAVRPAARSAYEQCLLVSTPCDACETHAIQAVARSGHRLAEGSHLLDVLALVRVWPSAVPDLASSLRYYASQQRTIQRRITRGTRCGYARTSCSDSTGYRTDGTRGAGIIRRVVPRNVPRGRPTSPYCRIQA